MPPPKKDEPGYAEYREQYALCDQSQLVDYDGLTIAELVPGRSFDEQSTMMSMRRWRHERSVTPDGDEKTVVRDRITFELRAPLRLATPAVATGLRALFGHRHRRLQNHFASG
jgi:ligand-binding SRPBCC domain-containing protein